MNVGKNGSIGPIEFLCAVAGALCSTELFGLTSSVFGDPFYAGVGSTIAMFAVMISQKRAGKFKVFGTEIFGIIYSAIMFLLLGYLYTAPEIIASYELRILMWLVTVATYFVVAKRD
ncbi:hypothetical protein HNP88_000378 [Methanococcus maripaludis]|uniref:Uncharacterized protein n=1 Tax=Methanococcus maripaludis TaxID=39152 RepID=A0A7J9NL91_METMI|nr:hypothetical protein [Methanococcus maripaludis]MBA2846194.1 hypothetical protein [Methanococcus maripaludis]